MPKHITKICGCLMTFVESEVVHQCTCESTHPYLVTFVVKSFRSDSKVNTGCHSSWSYSITCRWIFCLYPYLLSCIMDHIGCIIIVPCQPHKFTTSQPAIFCPAQIILLGKYPTYPTRSPSKIHVSGT